MDEPLRVAVFASGGGSNLQALLDRFNAGARSVARVMLVVASRPGIGALARAEAAGVPSVVIDARRLSTDEAAAAMLEVLGEHGIQLVVLAGYMHLVPAAVVERYRGRMLNVHPALLPSFGGQGLYGARVHRAVLDAGARVSGATVHLVDERYDTGPIVAQWPVPVLPDDSTERLAARVLEVEHVLLPAVVEAFARSPRSAADAVPPRAFAPAAAAPDTDAVLRLVRLTGENRDTSIDR